MRLIRHVAQQPLLGLIRDHQGLCHKDRAPVYFTSNDLQWLNLKKGHQGNGHSKDHQGDMQTNFTP